MAQQRQVIEIPKHPNKPNSNEQRLKASDSDQRSLGVWRTGDDLEVTEIQRKGSRVHHFLLIPSEHQGISEYNLRKKVTYGCLIS